MDLLIDTNVVIDVFQTREPFHVMMKGFDGSEVKIFTPEEICQYVDENLKE